MTALHLSLDIPADWSKIDPAREAVGLLVLALFGDDNLRDALAMVSEELLENAIKYSRPASSVALAIEHRDDGVEIAVTNVVDEATGHMTLLAERVAWVGSFETPAAAYSAALARVYAENRPGATGLGLARIAYEGRCGLACDTSVPGRVTVKALCPRSAFHGEAMAEAG